MPTESSLIVSEERGVTVVGFAQPTLLDSYHIGEVGKELCELAQSGNCSRMVLDMSTIKMISSQALSVMLTVRQKLEPLAGKMVICGIDPALYRVFKVTNLKSVFEFYADRNAAVESLISDRREDD